MTSLPPTRILAVDPGSNATAVVLFEGGKPRFAALVGGKHRKEWSDRLSNIAEELGEVLEGVDTVDLIAIERTIAHRNIRAAIVMAKTWGYLQRVLEVRYPTAMFEEVPKAAVCHVLGLKGNAKRAERQEAARTRFKWKSQDVCDAGAVGLAVIAMMENVS